MNLRQDSMPVQEYGINFIQLSMHFLHLVAYSRAQMYMFLYGVSYLVKIECRNAMLLENVNICRLMSHDSQVNRDTLREFAMHKKVRTRNYEYFQQKSSAPAH